MKHRLSRSAVWNGLMVACVGGGLLAVLRVTHSVAEVPSPRQIHCGYAMLAIASAAALVLVYAVAWWLLVGSLARRRPPLLATLQLFVVAWPGRYAPASIPYYGGRLAAADRLGLSRGAVAASLVYENLFVIATAGSLSIGLFLIGFRERLHGGTWLGLACAAVAASVAALHPAVVRCVIRLASSRVRRLSTLEDYVLPTRALAQIALAYASGSVFAGLIFFFSIRAVDGSAHPPLLLALAAYNIAGIAGMLAVAVPSGLGVREGVTVALIGALISPPTALSAAVLARLLALVADLALASGVVAVVMATRLVRQPPEPAVLAAEEHRAA